MEDQADVVGQCVVDDLREMGTWRTGFTAAQILGGIPGECGVWCKNVLYVF